MDRFIPRADQLSSLDQISIQAQAAKMMTSYRSQKAAMELMVGLAGAKSAAAALTQAGIGSQSRLALEAAMASVTGLTGAKSAAAALAQAVIGSQSRLALEAAMASVTELAGAKSAAAVLAQAGIGSQSRLALEAAMASLTGLAGAKSAAAALGIEPYQSLVSASNTLLEIRNQFGDIRYAQEGLASNLTESEDVAQLISKATSEAQCIAESTGFLLSAIEAQPNLQSKLMLWMVTSYFVTKIFDAIFSHIAGLIVTAVIAANPSNALQPKQVKQAVSQVLGASDILQDYRYVKADVLMVRNNPKTQSPVIAKFELGQTVLLIEKDKNGFSLVEWKDSESGVEIRGWVFTRYLAKFH